MTGLSAREDWDALRRRFAAQALGEVLAFCGWQAGTLELSGADFGARAEGDVLSCPPARRRGEHVPPANTAPCPVVRLRRSDESRYLKAGPVTLLWDGAVLTGVPPDWPRSVSPAAARFLLTARPLAETVPLDFCLAARRDPGSPYYFTCYMERRLRALLSRPGPEGSAAPGLAVGGRALALAVDRFPAAVRRGAEGCDPCFVNRYAVELAGEVRRFLRARPLTGAARPLLAAAEIALGNALRILLGPLPAENPPPGVCPAQ